VGEGEGAAEAGYIELAARVPQAFGRLNAVHRGFARQGKMAPAKSLPFTDSIETGMLSPFTS
jgi:hypothetical protein